MARVGKIKVPVEIYSCERDRWQALNALLSEQLEEARQWHLAAVREKRAAQADAERLFTALDGYIMARITGTDLRDYDDLAERAARAHRSLAGVSAEATGVWPDQSAQHAVLLEQIKDAYAEGKADAVALIRERAALALPDLARFTLDEVEAIVGLSAEAAPDGPIPDSEFIEPPVIPNMRAPESGGDNPAITPPPNPLNPYPFHEPLRVEHHSDEDKRQAWDEGYAAGVAVGQSLPSTGTGWDRGYAAGVAAERDQAWRWTIHVCPKGHKSLEPPLNGVCWKCWPGGRGPAEEHTAIRVAEVRR